MPDKWLKQEQQTNRVVNRSAGFSEYIRWMRSPLPEIDPINKQSNNETKLQILQLAAEQAHNYKDRLQENNRRTQLIAGEGNTFVAECPWRVRVGGETGAENILLPAFDSLGIPYIPSSTLRGVARSQAFWEISQKNINNILPKNGRITAEQIQNAKEIAEQRAEQEVSRYFGSLDVVAQDSMGKVIFLDAYPLSNEWGLQGRSLAIDMANNIWGWENNEPKYSPNPNTFLSLNKPKFLIGLRPRPHLSSDIFDLVKGWLIRGLQNGIGSQVNSGYGEMIIRNQPSPPNPFLTIKFTLQGQLIHGVKRYNNPNNPYRQDSRGNQQPDTYSEPEVRAIAFKSMLRYWFRTLALGYLPSDQVKDWESNLFGNIQPQKQGWLKCQLIDIRNANQREQNINSPCLQQAGTVKLSFSREIDRLKKDITTQLMTDLAWIMFHLGGVGQGARRPLYSRLNRDKIKPPYYRGCNLRVVNSDDSLWQLPEQLADFKIKFTRILSSFYRKLSQLTGNNFDLNAPLDINGATWREAIDANCRIIICAGNEQNYKPYALSILHCQELNPNHPNYNPQLCGSTDDRSPVWISHLGNYQVVTVFGATQGIRQRFVTRLRTHTTQYCQIFPFI